MHNDWIVKDEDQEILSVKCPPQYKTISKKDIVVWVDPLDGTNEYKRVRFVLCNKSSIYSNLFVGTC